MHLRCHSDIFILNPSISANGTCSTRSKRPGHVEPFLATRDMQIGDIVMLHVGKQDPAHESGIYAYGTVIYGPYILTDSPDDYCNNKLTVDIRIDRIEYEKPILT